VRTAAFTLRAFNVETSRILESARELNLALMRLQWWRDALTGIYQGKTLEHPVITALSTIVKAHKLSKHWFTRLLDARQSDLESEGSPKTILDVERYAENTASALLYLTLEAAGVRSTPADHAASHVGKAEGISLLLKSSYHHSSYRRSYIPIEVTAKHGVSQEDIYRRMNSQSLADAVYDVASVADAHLKQAHALASTVPQAAIPVLLPAVPTRVLLESLKKVHFNVFDPKLNRGICGVSPLWIQLLLKWHMLRRTY
jgi:NADH dehydrogenase [ubiquinone] 1 alpha subcomplex assembly factor 6